MIIHKSKAFWIAGSIFTLTFAVLFIIRLGILERILSHPQTLSLESINAVSERDTWMNIFQNERKIGFSHTRFYTDTTILYGYNRIWPDRSGLYAHKHNGHDPGYQPEHQKPP
jgi:hypothetical protein